MRGGKGKRWEYDLRAIGAAVAVSSRTLSVARRLVVFILKCGLVGLRKCLWLRRRERKRDGGKSFERTST